MFANFLVRRRQSEKGLAAVLLPHDDYPHRRWRLRGLCRCARSKRGECRRHGHQERASHPRDAINVVRPKRQNWRLVLRSHHLRSDGIVLVCVQEAEEVRGMGRSKASGDGGFVVLAILLGVGWLALTWPYYVFGWFLEITYLLWLTYMAAMLGWYRHGRKPAASWAPAFLRHPGRSRGVIAPTRAHPALSRTQLAPSYQTPTSSYPVPNAVPGRRVSAPQLPPPSAAGTTAWQQHPGMAIRLADRPPHGIGPILLDRLAAAGIRTCADYAGHRIDRSGARATVYLVRSDGTAVQVQGIGPDKAIALDAWRAVLLRAR